MAGEDQPVESLSFIRQVVLTVDRWPEKISLTSEWLKMAHVYGGVVKEDLVTFTIGNGSATYRLLRDQKHGQGFVAELIEGNSPANLKSLGRKFRMET